MKAIILAGGAGSRLYPLTQVASKQLQAVYDKPMIYYPLTVLIAAGIREFCLISTEEDLPRYEALFGSGEKWGLSFDYRVQPKPEGIAQAFIIADSFVGDDDVCLMLGDNPFSSVVTTSRRAVRDTLEDLRAALQSLPMSCVILGVTGSSNLTQPQERHSQSKRNQRTPNPISPHIPGIYIYDNSVLDIAKNLKNILS